MPPYFGLNPNMGYITEQELEGEKKKTDESYKQH